MAEQRKRIFDCDQHMYEERDSFTRYLPKEFLGQAVAPVTLADGREVILAGDRVVVCLEPEFGQVYRPGSLKEMLKSMASGNPDETYQFEPMHESYQNREARLRVMDEQGLDQTIIYPGGWALVAEEYVRGVEPLYANYHSFNRYMNEVWGFNHQDRIYSPALLSLRDLPSAVKELEFVLNEGARFIMLPTGPQYGRSPGDPYFDPFWKLVNEAKASVCYHISEFYYNSNVAPAWGHDASPIHFRMSAWQWMNTYGQRPIEETLSALIFDNLFGRFPDINVLVSEFGAEWVPHFVRHMDKSRGMGRNGPWIGGQLAERPSQVFRKHIRVVPYPEDDIPSLVKRLGYHESIVMGSDFPHAEGIANPADYRKLLAELDESVQDDIMYNNAQQLISR
ncbi:amidohydrolase family protein [Streptomyces sp. NPDC096057]|uniref:amidohydrolase family protein n=1 Tax=Streptomyces sp. NPDC096057 TaxID=3155543 RepID=UPI003322FB1C